MGGREGRRSVCLCCEQTADTDPAASRTQSEDHWDHRFGAAASVSFQISADAHPQPSLPLPDLSLLCSLHEVASRSRHTSHFTTSPFTRPRSPMINYPLVNRTRDLVCVTVTTHAVPPSESEHKHTASMFHGAHTTRASQTYRNPSAFLQYLAEESVRLTLIGYLGPIVHE